MSENSHPDISFVIPVHNCLELTRACLRSLFGTLPPISYEVILVDDASDPETRDFLAGLPAPCRSIRNDQNAGYAVSVNRGAALARGHLLCLLNNDLAFSRDWLPPMLRLLQTGESVGAVGNIQINPQTGLLDHAGVFFNLQGLPTHAHKNRRYAPPGKFSERNAATAACLLMRKATFEELHGFSEEYRNGMEDIDLCVRLRLSGYRILVSHESVIVHHVSSTEGRHRHNDANTAIFARRWAETTASWGRREWGTEYLRRYARHWWKMTPGRFLHAVWLVLVNRLTGRKNVVPLPNSQSASPDSDTTR